MRLAKKNKKNKNTEHERVHFFGTTEHERATPTRTHNVQIEAPTEQYYPTAMGCVHVGVCVFMRASVHTCGCVLIYMRVCVSVCVERAEKESVCVRVCA